MFVCLVFVFVLWWLLGHEYDGVGLHVRELDRYGMGGGARLCAVDGVGD
jgi:hypothetical protein